MIKKNVQKRWASRAVLSAAILVCMCLGFTKRKYAPVDLPVVVGTSVANAVKGGSEKVALYEKLGLAAMGLSWEAFNYALNGFNNLVNAGKIQKDNILTILDFSLPSNKKRLFTIDLTTGELVYNTYASHGKNSGKLIPTNFSNQENSNKSSLGFYITRETYNGKHGCSLRLEGEEEGFNSNALSRGIVMHSAAYVNEEVASRQGFVGRSQGCPAVPEAVSKSIINTIKNGSCLFIYSPDKYYIAHSKMIVEAA